MNRRINTPQATLRHPRSARRIVGNPLALAISLAMLPGLVLAQTTAPSQRFTPVTGDATPLYPLSTTTPAQQAPLLSGQRDPGDDRSDASGLAQVRVEVERDGVPADGQTAVRVQVQLLDAEGQPLSGQTFATIEHSGGRIRLPGGRTDEFGPGRLDAERAVPGVQLPINNGRAEFELLAPFEPQDVMLRVTAGHHVAEGLVGFVPEMRDLIATGLIEGVINFRHGGNGLIGRSEHGDGFERDLRRWERQFNNGKANAAARTAFFIKGTIKGEYLLTAAYDSDKETRARMLRDIRPEEFYPVYGDSSLRGFDARSSDRLYVRVDRGRSYVLYGDFQTGETMAMPTGVDYGMQAAPRVLGMYNRTATGLGWHFDNARVRGNVFAIHDSLRQVIEELPASGSGPYGLRNNAVLEASERVEVVVRDRNQPSRIVSVRPLARLVDYSFEPFSGRILLSSFLSSFDSDLNPVSLRITYEVDQGTKKFMVYGGDAQLRVGENGQVGASMVEDRNPFAEFRMASANAGYRFGENTWLMLEAAQTQSEVNTNPINMYGTPALQGLSGRVKGDAWRAEFGHEGERFGLRLFAGRSDPEFNNPASPLYGGRGEYALNTRYQVNERFQLYAEALRSEDRNPDGGERDAGSVGARIKASERITVDFGLRSIRETVGRYYTWASNIGYGNLGGLSGGWATGAAGGALGFGQQPLDPSTGLPIILNGNNQGLASDLPIGTKLSSDMARIGVGVRANERLMLGGEYEQSYSGEDRNRVALGLDYQLLERSRLYGRYERQTGLGGPNSLTADGRRADAVVLGVDTTWMRDTQLFSEYRLRDAVSGRDIQTASGIRNRWELREGLRMDTMLEHTNVIAGNIADSTGAGVAIEYYLNPLWHGSARLEHRISGDIASTTVDERYNTTLLQLMLARKLDRDWTLLARNYLLKTRYKSRGDVFQDRLQVGLAYRDTDTNRVNALARYEYKIERDESGVGWIQPGMEGQQEVRSSAHIVSAHADWHPSRPWWLTGRIAAKWQNDRVLASDGSRIDSDFNATLFSGRVVYDITENWDIGLMGSAFRGQSGANQYAAGFEVGRLLRQNLWLSLGYNATGFRGDDDLAGYEYTQKGAYLRLRFKFDERLFQREDARYRTPDRYPAR
ncbi:MAG: Ig-like domain-containing protein [Pseudomonadota bacterium]|nr:Ig-like domain-containing protein [Pseudomonadota bacterium]MDO5610896.1 Ig-like domain-containing protein [Pseudomonadota bacterium]